MPRPRGSSVRLRLTLSYAAVVVLTGGLLLAVVWLFLLRYVPAGPIGATGVFVPNRSDLLRVFVPAAAATLLALLLVGLLGGWVLAGRVLAPLNRIGEAARLAADGSLSHRIRLPGHDDEFRELADAFDTMLAQLEAFVAGQQRFAANASHELRTPLAITSTLLDVARRNPSQNRDELLIQLQTVNTRAIDLTEALLLLSRADQGSFTRTPVDLSLVAEEAAETLLPWAEAQGVAVDVSGDVATAHGSSALLLQLATNLIQNAIVHNEHGGWVSVRTEIRLDRVALVVENTGPLVSAGVVATITEAFQRGDARLHHHQAGVGLGLTIVAAIVRAHSGVLTILPRDAGGLTVTVDLPGSAA